MQVLDTWTKRGLEQGKREGELNTILRQLNRKLGQSLSTELQQQVNQLSDTQLTELSEALLDFTSMQNLVDWLATSKQV